jgi:tetratricopeptide (TPR) repeat protein
VPLIAITLAAVTATAFAGACGNGFVNYDDDEYITENPIVPAGLTWDGARWALGATAAANWHPLTWLSLEMDSSLHGRDPRGYHLSSVLLHAANAGLLCLALYRLSGTIWPSALAAALFALHPLRAESVAWAAERKDVLCALFFMLSLHVYARYTERRTPARYLALAGCLALGLSAKPMLVTVPAVLLLLDCWPLKRMADNVPRSSAHRRLRIRWNPALGSLILEKLPLFGLAAIASVLTIDAQAKAGAAVRADQLDFAARLMQLPVAYVTYLAKILWPRDLAPFYPYSASLPIGQAVGAAALLVGITGIALVRRRSQPYVAVGWLWYMGMLVPVIGLVQVGSQALADRYTYLPSIGVFVLLAWCATELAARSHIATASVTAAALASLLVCAAATMHQVADWHDSVRLWEHALSVTEKNEVAHNNLGLALAAENRWNEAAEHYRKALSINPDYGDAHFNLALAVRRQGDLDGAASHLAEAIRVMPEYVPARLELGQVRLQQARLAEAIAVYRGALRVNPEQARTYDRLGIALFLDGQRREAIACFRQAVSISPSVPAYLFDLGHSLYGAGHIGPARECYRRAGMMDPAWMDGAAREAWTLAAAPEEWQRNGRLALFVARGLCEATDYQQATYLDILGISLAEVGAFDEAVATMRQALRLAPATTPAALRTEMQARLRLFEARHPYRDRKPLVR